MQQNFKIILLLAILIYSITGCSQKQKVEEYNKPALYWYNKMIKQISNNDLDNADDTYTSLESEHRNSPLLSSAIMIIANAHMKEEEYQMANYYFDEYLKRFSLKSDAGYIEYLKIKSNFLAFKSQFREQELLTQTLIQTDKFIKIHKDSKYLYLIKTIKSRLLMAKAVFDKEISDLYGRVDKPKAQEIYKQKASKSWTKLDNIEPVKVPWYKSIFE